MIESVNGHAFVNFSAFLGNPKTMHFAPGEKRYPGRDSKEKPKKKSKRKTQRDNERAARFQEKKRQEKEAAGPEASSENPPSHLVQKHQEREAAVTEASSESPSSHSVPSAMSSPRVEFSFSEPAPADVSADLQIVVDIQGAHTEEH